MRNFGQVRSSYICGLYFTSRPPTVPGGSLMATRPIRLPFVRWGTWLLIVGLIGILIGCGRKEDPPAVVERPKPVEEDKKLANEDVGLDPKTGSGTNGERKPRAAVLDDTASISESAKQLSRDQARFAYRVDGLSKRMAG